MFFNLTSVGSTASVRLYPRLHQKFQIGINPLRQGELKKYSDRALRRPMVEKSRCLFRIREKLKFARVLQIVNTIPNICSQLRSCFVNVHEYARKYQAHRVWTYPDGVVVHIGPPIRHKIASSGTVPSVTGPVMLKSVPFLPKQARSNLDALYACLSRNSV